jgi:hypothetical protein
MKRLGDLVAEDSNQFGPGTDLLISVMAVLLVMIFISGHLYTSASKENRSYRQAYETERARAEALKSQLEAERRKNLALEGGGNFTTSSVSFPAADFYTRPVTRLVDPLRAQQMVNAIVGEYESVQNEFPFIFVIGHASQIDDPLALDKSESARMERNWEYAGRRAGLIARLVQEHLTADQKERIVVVSAGEMDMRAPQQPDSPDNAWVEVVFGKQWKLPARQRTN